MATDVSLTPLSKAKAAGIVTLIAVSLALLAGCASLLPKAHSDEPSGFTSFEAARDAFARVEPLRSTTEDMKELGFDPAASANVRETPYPQWLAQMVQSANVPLPDLDQGIRDCVALRQQCRAYQFRFTHVDRNRTGNFFLDFLNFDRTTQTSGWRFEGMVLVSDKGLVLFRNHAGEPRIEQTERTRNPLGPFQSLDRFIR